MVLGWQSLRRWAPPGDSLWFCIFVGLGKARRYRSVLPLRKWSLVDAQVWTNLKGWLACLLNQFVEDSMIELSQNGSIQWEPSVNISKPQYQPLLPYRIGPIWIPPKKNAATCYGRHNADLKSSPCGTLSQVSPDISGNKENGFLETKIILSQIVIHGWSLMTSSNRQTKTRMILNQKGKLSNLTRIPLR